MIEALEGRMLFSAIDTSTVALFDAGGNPATINRHLAAWFIVHGDNMDKSFMTTMAAAVQAQVPSNQWQVLIVDWSDLASAQTNATRNGQAVGDRVAQMINQAHLPASRVNLIGFSMGGAVINRIAIDLKTKTTQVNRLVGIDAAAGRVGPYDPAVFGKDSAFSVAFGANDKYGGQAGTLSADESVLLSGLSSDDLTRHAQVFSVVTTMWQRDAGEISKGNDGVSELFSIPNILAGPTIAMRQGIFAGGYDAVMACGFQSGLPNDLGPLSFTFVNTRRHTQVFT
jgi:pimeloyl-ACP methyl ester carboxylesterase